MFSVNQHNSKQENATLTIKNSLFAEIYGTEIIGAVRSVFTTLIVFSTALGPISFGLLLDGGWTYASVFWLSVVVLLLIVAWSFRILTMRP